jgi:cyclopropane fatty-acyl-phospholipid synthase-like methyltransferase
MIQEIVAENELTREILILIFGWLFVKDKYDKILPVQMCFEKKHYDYYIDVDDFLERHFAYNS